MLPVEQANPAGHGAQPISARPPGEPRKLPAAHAVGALTPTGQKAPAGQSTHAVAPEAGWYEPASQPTQLLCPLLTAKVPGLHASGAAERARQ